MSPTANWLAEAAESAQAPVYYIAIDGLATPHYSTAPVKSPAVAKTVLMDVPQGLATTLDLLGGRRGQSRVTVRLHDVSGAITDLVSTEADGAPVSTLVNRKVTVYGGYRDLVEADYAAIFTGRVRKCRMAPGLTAYDLVLADLSYLLDGEMMTAATDASNIVLQGNVVNVMASILRDTFSTVDADFPLDSITGSPDGLGIADADLDIAGMKAQRDFWHVDDVVKVTFRRPEPARQHLEREFCRVFQAFWSMAATGQLGAKFDVPALPSSAASTLDTDDIVELVEWERVYADHLNKFRYLGDYDAQDNEYDTELYSSETTEDTTNQTATEETIEHIVESRWLQSSLNGVEIATELAARRRLRYLETPARIVVMVNFKKRTLVEGEVVAVTHPEIPDLRTGSRGVTSRLMTITAIAPDFFRGLLRIELLDTGYRRYGVIAPSTAPSAYTSATVQEQNTYGYICDADDQEFSNDDAGHRWI